MQSEQKTRRQTIEQERGRQAWDNIKGIKDLKNKDLEKKYRSVARSLNAMIQINGLGQTLGFLFAKSKPDRNKPEKENKNEHYYLQGHLTQWMREHFTATNISAMGEGHSGLLDWVTNKEKTSADYRRATTECLAFGAWLRRFAEAELEEGDNT